MRPMTYIEIAGKRYPLRFSLAAMRAVTEKFGSIDELGNVMSGKDNEKTLESIAWVLGIMIRQGCEYKNLFDSTCTPEKNDPVKDGKYIPLSDEYLAVAMDVTDLPEMSKKITEAMKIGQSQEIETKKQGKNAETT